MLNWYFFFRLEDLPDEILLMILQHCPLPELLQSINRVCKRFHTLIENSTCLWKYFEFDIPLSLDPPSLQRVLTPARIRNFRRLCLPEALFGWSAPQVDFHLFRLFEATNLSFLDLTGIAISSLAFLPYLSDLEVLILDSCPHIRDSDIVAIQECPKLLQLYIGFTKVTPAPLTAALPESLVTLECSGVVFSELELHSLLLAHSHLLFLTVSLDTLLDPQPLISRYPNTTLSIFRVHIE